MMRMHIYNFLVNRHAGIRVRYHSVHDGAFGLQRLFSYVYLLWLNFCYYVLFCRFLGREKDVSVYEEKRLLVKHSESEDGRSADEVAERLSRYEVISFDLFDTLVFRPFSEPADLFYFLEESFGILDLKRIRMEQEYLARKEHLETAGSAEITLKNIWERMERETGIPKEAGMQAECALEERFCYANPFMRQVYDRLQAMGKQIFLISDMYLPADFLERLLKKCGYTGFQGLYVSCEYKKSKADGGLYRIAGEKAAAKSWIHVGDNRYSDVKMAKKSGIAALYYPNVNARGAAYRSYDMSPLIGGAYRGIVNNHLHSGANAYSMEYEYGFIYGGIFVLGYCSFIHRYCQCRGMDRLLFLSRDGDILKQVYDSLYPGEDTVYAYWSRTAAVKLMAEDNRYDYFRRYLYHKVNQGITIQKILSDMELEGLSDAFGDCEGELTDKNVDALKQFLQEHMEQIAELYRTQREAAGIYYGRLLKGARRAAAVDIGWAGSGAVSLAYLAERVWKLPCELTGILAGTNTVHNAEPDASEYFLQSGKLTSYLYSMSHNRDLMKRHDPAKGFNIFWELLLASPQRKFLGFYLSGNGCKAAAEELERWESDERVAFRFGAPDLNQKGVEEIRRGVLDFTAEYAKHFKDTPFMLEISGRDAYAPVLAAAGFGEKYLREIASRFDLEIGI